MTPPQPPHPHPRRPRRRPMLVGLLVGAGLMTALLGAPSEAHAKAERVAVYPFEKVWSAAVRFLRVDEGLRVTEKDPDTGYVLFELREEGKAFTGALEVIRTTNESREAVRLVLRIEDRPHYSEQGMVERLARKLESELGRPVPPPEKKKVPPTDSTPPTKQTE